MRYIITIEVETEKRQMLYDMLWRFGTPVRESPGMYLRGIRAEPGGGGPKIFGGSE